MKKRFQLWVRGVSVVVLAITLLATGCRASSDVLEPASEKTTAPAPVVAAPTPVASPPKGGLPDEGIQVHGRWTIEVRNPDGTLAEVREFENALDNQGSLALSKFLARTYSVGGWGIVLSGDNDTSGAFHNGPFYYGQILESAGITANDPRTFKTLTVGVPGSGTNQGKLVLSGTAVALSDGNIGRVSTLVTSLANTEAPSPTYQLVLDSVIFTATVLNTPISLLTGQQVLVTVVISFS